jgi:hypothetical protein
MNCFSSMMMMIENKMKIYLKYEDFEKEKIDQYLPLNKRKTSSIKITYQKNHLLIPYSLLIPL